MCYGNISSYKQKKCYYLPKLCICHIEAIKVLGIEHTTTGIGLLAESTKTCQGLGPEGET